MRKQIIFFISLIFAVSMVLSACGSESKTLTYEFLSFETPTGFTQSGSSSEPFFDDGDGQSISIHIDTSDSEYLTAEDMLENRLEPDQDSLSDFNRMDDYIVDGVSCPNVYFFDSELDAGFGDVYMIHGNSLVTFSLQSYKNEFPGDVSERFYEFLDTVHIIE